MPYSQDYSRDVKSVNSTRNLVRFSLERKKRKLIRAAFWTDPISVHCSVFLFVLGRFAFRIWDVFCSHLSSWSSSSSSSSISSTTTTTTTTTDVCHSRPPQSPLAMQYLRWSVARLSPRRSGLDPGSFHVRFMLHKVALGQTFIPVYPSRTTPRLT
jgi:hypothetical protein